MRTHIRHKTALSNVWGAAGLRLLANVGRIAKFRVRRDRNAEPLANRLACLRRRLTLAVCGVAGLWLLANGGLIAADAFDDDYTDCPATQRVDDLGPVTITRTEETDELLVSWPVLDVPSLGLGAGIYRTQITVIAEGPGPTVTRHVSLGSKSVTLDDLEPAGEWEVSVALTRGDYVISDIARPVDVALGFKPRLYSPFYYVPDASALDDAKYLEGFSDSNLPAHQRALNLHKAVTDEVIEEHAAGTFYYLGYNHSFDNWYVGTGMTNPATPKFRIGLAHALGLDLDELDVDHFRLRLEDSSGDDVLGFDAAMVTDTATYGADRVLVFGLTNLAAGARRAINMAAVDASIFTEGDRFSNIKTSNQIDRAEGGRLPAVQDESNAHWRRYFKTRTEIFCTNWICDAAEVASVVSPDDPGRQVALNAPELYLGEEGLHMYAARTDGDDPEDPDEHEIWTGIGSIGGGNAYRQSLTYVNLLPAIMLGAQGTHQDDPVDYIPHNGGIRRLFAPTPDAYYDIAPSVLARDGNYTITVWAEDDADTVISPRSTLTFNLQERLAQDMTSNQVCFGAADDPLSPGLDYYSYTQGEWYLGDEGFDWSAATLADDVAADFTSRCHRVNASFESTIRGAFPYPHIELDSNDDLVDENGNLVTLPFVKRSFFPRHAGRVVDLTIVDK